MTRTLTYAEAISEGTVLAMERDPSIFMAGIGTTYSSAVFGTSQEALDRFGTDRVFDVPAMENALTGIGIGAAAMGKHPLLVHLRNDFMFLALDQMVNLASKWRYMFGDRAGSMPLTVRAIVGRGWGQGATHSQSLHATLAHFPGLTVLLPAQPKDAKGMLLGALRAKKPCVIIEHRTLYPQSGTVPEGDAPTPIEGAEVLRAGSDITIIGASQSVIEGIRAAACLADANVQAEVIDIRVARPLDRETILTSIRKTGRALVLDTSWAHCGLSAEVAAIIAEAGLATDDMAVRRITPADCPAPVSKPLEDAFYPTVETIARTAAEMVGADPDQITIDETRDDFNGPY
ncbi:MAG: transketolase C-terminal domain-containing protein [Rhodospirillales bacterium]